MDSGLSLALSFLIGGVFLMTVLNTQTNLQKTATINYLEEQMHHEMDGLRDIIKTDLEKIGYNIDINQVGKAMVLKDLDGNGDADYIKLYLDVPSIHEDDTDNDLDSIMIWASDTSQMSHTDNPNDRFVYRMVNDGNTLTIGSGVTFFKIDAEDQSEMVDDLDMVSVSFRVETPYPFEEQYYSAFWSGNICPKNLRKQ